MAQLEEEKREHDNKMKKMETEMEQVFEMKVREKKQKLKDSEADVSICIDMYLFYLSCLLVTNIFTFLYLIYLLKHLISKYKTL